MNSFVLQFFKRDVAIHFSCGILAADPSAQPNASPWRRAANIPMRNRVAKADQYRSELEYRQAELRMEQSKKQVRIEVHNAQYALDQTGARVQAARKARDLAQRSLALAELDLVSAQTTHEKAKVELDRATGQTLEHNGILLQDAIQGMLLRPSP